MQKSSFDIPIHKISVEKESYLHQITGKEMMVNSFHHQAIKVVGKGLNVVAKSPDGIIEAVEAKDADVLAIQWHPETMLQMIKSVKISSLT
ncbi:gamma-glutamyl-gamma-aminobutyrate hydrolase family protein [Jeotgalibaca ciconiae]|uniref:gamma-glutamyl-gamma-aminobutyrate hydrolase family protein n=1 Tax=Jeotgalibaca ciconiae TaxID=2496265 RepID=UPI00223E5E74|nr:gamma-glutamyl-gamma-aminobutyrate hydrolase family protein [Jeotgalibaca ciconiae]